MRIVAPIVLATVILTAAACGGGGGGSTAGGSAHGSGGSGGARVTSSPTAHLKPVDQSAHQMCSDAKVVATAWAAGGSTAKPSSGTQKTSVARARSYAKKVAAEAAKSATPGATRVASLTLSGNDLGSFSRRVLVWCQVHAD